MIWPGLVTFQVFVCQAGLAGACCPVPVLTGCLGKP
jgi:hypothetical protein